jgi:hypothetical protein
VQDLGCVEFSGTRPLPGTTDFHLQARFHKGNFTGTYVESGVLNYYTSFRAFEGASGAPVVLPQEDGKGAVVGMLIAEHEESVGVECFLARREIERDGQKYFQQNWYLLPTGVAIGAEGPLAALTDLGVTPAVVCRSG